MDKRNGRIIAGKRKGSNAFAVLPAASISFCLHIVLIIIVLNSSTGEHESDSPEVIFIDMELSPEKTEPDIQVEPVNKGLKNIVKKKVHKPKSSTIADGKKGNGKDEKSDDGRAEPNRKITSTDLINSVAFSDLSLETEVYHGGTGRAQNPYAPRPGKEGLNGPTSQISTDWSHYFSEIRRKVNGYWRYPTKAQRDWISGTALIRITYEKTGRLQTIKLLRSSDYEILDRAALAAVRKAGNMQPFPIGTYKSTLTVNASFRYKTYGNKAWSTVQGMLGGRPLQPNFQLHLYIYE